MAHEEDHGKSPAELADRVWELAEKIRFCMFSTWDGEHQRQRPLSAFPERDAHAIYFLIDYEGGKTARQKDTTVPPRPSTVVEQVEQFPSISLGFADPKAGDYVTVIGQAKVTNDRAKIKELFSPFAKAWWDSADDPSIRLLTVTPEEGELWEGPNKLIAAAVMLTAAVTGAKPAVGEHGAVRL